MYRAFRRNRLVHLAVLGLAATALGGCERSRIAQIEQHFPSDYRQRHPIMVSPQGAYVATQCGQWPHDIGVGDGLLDNMNRPNWNHGCASQQNFAAMVAQPSDLLRPRAETPIDATRRQTNLGRYRAGTSPGPHTVHSPMQPLTDVKSAVGGGR
ncbi:MAG: CpaD family pilus assembly lipoprotein [Phreatobacter sp.]